MKPEQLPVYYKNHNLSLHAAKTKVVVIDFRRTCTHQHPLMITDGAAAEIVNKIKFLWVYLEHDLTSIISTTEHALTDYITTWFRNSKAFEHK